MLKWNIWLLIIKENMFAQLIDSFCAKISNLNFKVLNYPQNKTLAKIRDYFQLNKLE